jgi:hypothetical protein
MAGAVESPKARVASGKTDKNMEAASKMFVAITLDRRTVIRASRMLPNAWSKAAHFSAIPTISKVIVQALDAERPDTETSHTGFSCAISDTEIARSIGSKPSLTK